MSIQENGAKPATPYEVLVGLDFSELGERAFEQAIALSQGHEKAELHAVIVASAQGDRMRLPGSTASLPADEAREKARLRVAELVEGYRAKNGTVPLERVAVYVVTGEPADMLVALSEALDADVIVVGTHGRTGVNRMLLGSVAEEVVRRATTGVYVVRPRDFVRGERVPEIQPPLKPGEHSLKPWVSARTYHYVDRGSQRPAYVLEVT